MATINNSLLVMSCDPVTGMKVTVVYGATQPITDYAMAGGTDSADQLDLGPISASTTINSNSNYYFPNCDNKQWYDAINNRLIQIGGCGPGIPPVFQVNPVVSVSDAVFTTPGSNSWTCPWWVTKVLVICWGPGADGAMSVDGGGGACAVGKYVAVTPGVTYSAVVGDHNTTNKSHFAGDSQTIQADYANGTTGGLAANSTGNFVFSGGNGGSGTGGSSAAPNANGINGSAGGVAPPGGGSGGVGNNGFLPGGGGALGKTGAAGMVAIMAVPEGCPPSAVVIQGAALASIYWANNPPS